MNIFISYAKTETHLFSDHMPIKKEIEAVDIINNNVLWALQVHNDFIICYIHTKYNYTGNFKLYHPSPFFWKFLYGKENNIKYSIQHLIKNNSYLKKYKNDPIIMSILLGGE